MGSNYGSAECPCIGLDNVPGEVPLYYDGKKAMYPADIGGSCEAWDDGVYPDACEEGGKPGKGKGFCAEPWCYVDPCNCDLETPPKSSKGIPGGMSQGRPLYYSYATCVGKDEYTSENHKDAKIGKPDVCKEEVDEKDWGKEDCRCIGISGKEGSFPVEGPDGKDLAYPAGLGSNCSAWDADVHPDCQKDKAPDWCDQKWCYVDPCSCGLEVPPKTSVYASDVDYEGRPVYFSYATCGGKDAYTADNKKACVNQKTEDKCKAESKCAWDGKKCLGKELVEVCGKVEDTKAETKDNAYGVKPVLAVLSAFTLSLF